MPEKFDHYQLKGRICIETGKKTLIFCMFNYFHIFENRYSLSE